MHGRRHASIPRARAAVATASLLLLALSLLISHAHAQEGARIMLTGSCIEVRIEVLASEAAYTSDFLGPGGDLGLTNRDLGGQVVLSNLPAGELVLGIRVSETGDTFRTGPASRNPDNIAHARLSRLSSGWAVAFEDFRDGGDRDFNDAVLSVTEATCAPTTVAPPPTPRYTVTLGIDPASTGSGETRGEGTYREGAEATLTALPDADSTFAGWSGDCSELDPSATLTVVVDRDLACPAVFHARAAERTEEVVAEDPSVSVANTRTSPATVEVGEGATFRIAVTLASVPETSSLELRVVYDPAHLEYTGARWNEAPLPQCTSDGSAVSCGFTPASGDLAIDLQFTALAETTGTETVATATVRPGGAPESGDATVSEPASASVAITAAVADAETGTPDGRGGEEPEAPLAEASLPRLGDGSAAAVLAVATGESASDPRGLLLLLGLGQSLIVGGLLGGRRQRIRARVGRP